MIKKTLLTAILLLSVLTTGAWQSQNRSEAELSVKASESVLLQTGTFAKTAPANGATNVNPVNLVLSWQAYTPTPDAYSYCIKEGSPCVANDPRWTRTDLNTSVTLTDLTYGKTYYWQVRAIFCGGCVPKVFIYADNGTVFTFQTRLTHVTIVGNAGVPGAVLSYTDGIPRTVTANASGAYSITVPFNWTGTVTPSKAGYFFTPRSASFTNLTAPQTIQNFSAVVAYSISGNVGIPGLTFSYVDITTQTVTADGSGNYSFLVPSGWSGTITPTHACYTFNPLNRVYTNVTTNQTAQNYTATFNNSSGCADIDVLIAGSTVGGYVVPPDTSIRVAYAGIDNGPAKIVSVNNVDILAALRVIWREPGPRFSYSEMMGLPVEQLSNEYWFPWYNFAAPNSMDQGFRIANVDSAANTVEVRVGTTLLDTIALGGGASVRVGYPGVDNGPIKILCTTCSNTGTDKIIAALRVIWKEPGFRASYSEMMGLPKEQLSSEYWFPWYNNAVVNSMDQGFRIANVDSAPNTVEVRVGTTLLETISLNGGGSTRVGYTIDNGPVRIVCTTCSNTGSDKIIAALRVIWKEPGYRSSYSEMMGLPKEQLSTQYWFPWYNNAAANVLDQGFRIANVDSSQHTIQVWVGTTKLTNPDITLDGGASIRVGYNVDNGPIRVVCTDCSGPDDRIIVALRVIWKEPGVRTSYSEMMGLPNEALSAEYWFPWYNNASTASMDQGFRIAVP